MAADALPNRPRKPRWMRWGRWALTLLVAAAIIGGLMRSAMGAISIGGAYGTRGTASSLTWSATMLSGSNRVLTVRVVNVNTAVTVTNVTFNGSALTYLATATSGSGSSHVRATVWYMVAPPATTANVVVTLSASTRVVAGTLDFAGVSQTTPFGTVATAGGTGGNSSLTVAAANGDLVSDLFSGSGSAVSGFTAGSGQSAVSDSTGTTSADAFGAASTKTGTTSTTVSYDWTNSANWAMVGFAVKPAGPAISGTVFEDVNYGGGAGRDMTTSGGVAADGATVELYNASGSYLTSTTTDAAGVYAFNGLANSTSYHVRVVGGTVKSGRSGGGGSEAGVMTYRTNASSGSPVAVTDYVGGTDPALVDPGSAASGASFSTSTFIYSAGLTGTAQAVTKVTLASSNVSGVDFGYNFDTVTNTNNSGTGSLRQAITNANALAGDASLAQSGRTAAIENLVWMISDGSAGAGLRSSNDYFATSVATIAPTSALPTVTGALVVDATTQHGYTSTPLIDLDGASAGSSHGLQITAGGSTVKGLIVRRFVNGIYLNSNGNTVQGCWLGVTAAGTAASGNSAAGVYVTGSNNAIGGTTSAARNVVSGNGSGNGTGNAGILVASGTGNTLQGNYVGLNAAGTALVANWPYGIDVSSASNTIGGTAAGAGNVSSGHQYDGIILRPGSDGTVVQGNILGANAANSAALGNGRRGITIQSGSNSIGGTAAGAGNVIRGQGGAGLDVENNNNGNAILGNSIFGNTGIGIDLRADGQTSNDGVKSSGQPNLLMDYPVFTRAALSGSTLVVAGYVGSAANQSTFAGARVEVFISDLSNPNGQGKTYLGYLTSDASGNFSGSISGVGGITADTSKITGTATDTSNNTSEFGPNQLVINPLLAGTVFEDVNYGGGAGRDRTTAIAAGGAAVSGATVELYTAAGAYVANTTTAANGSYSFSGQPAASYLVRVLPSSVRSTRSGSTASLVPVQTWRYESSGVGAAAVTTEVGGARPDVADSAAAATLSWTQCATESGGSSNPCAFTGTRVVRFGTGSSWYVRVATDGIACSNANFGDPAAGSSKVCQVLTPHLHSVSSASTVAGADASVDFGFTFDTVVNTNDSGIGSLRQAITNANTLGGDASLAQNGRTAAIENLVFMIGNGSAGSGLRSANNFFSSGVASIALGSALPSVGAALIADAQTQPGWTANPVVELNGSGAGSASGVTLASSGSTLRGLVINRFALSGVSITSSGNTVQGCWIGLSAAGTAASGNAVAGISAAAGGNTIGGTTATQRNVVSGNGSSAGSGNAGILLGGGSGNTVQGNYVGLNAAGSAALANLPYGIDIASSTGNTIGGTAAGAGNVSSGNSLDGLIARPGSTGNVVQGNIFGANAANSAVVANGRVGANLSGNSNTLGGTAAGAGNVVRGNTTAGVSMFGNVSGNAVQGNSIWGNGGVGIDLGYDGQTSNDGAKSAGQPNLLMDYPVFTSASLAGTTLSVAGYVGSAAGQSTFASSRVEVFISDVSNPNGQGKTYLGYLTTDASGNFNGTISGVAGITTGSSKITGTATDTSNNTSEFGPNLTVASISLSGTVFEDVNYGGGAGRSLAGSSGAGVTGATVELYDAAGTYISSTTTASGGGYSFAGMTADASYFVRVAGPTVASTRSGSTAALVGVLTWRSTAASGSAVAVTDFVGGTNPALADPGAASSGAAFNTSTSVFSAGLSGTAQAVTPVSVTTGTITGLDFGFNFDTVVNTNNSGAGSLRQAITNANTLAGDASLAQSGRTAAVENLVFMLGNGSAGSGLRSAYNVFTTSAGGYNVATITPTSTLPTISTAMVIDAQTQPGWTLAPLIELKGSSAGSNVSGLTISGANTTVRGFVINRFGGEGIEITASGGCTVQGNYLGTNAAGSAASANTKSGVWIHPASSTGHVVGGTTAARRNVISGNGIQGVALSGSTGAVISGNYIGVNAAGTTTIGNASTGVLLYGSVQSATVGGTGAGAGNVVAGNGAGGVVLLTGATGNAVLGNSIYGNSSIGLDLGADGQTSNDGVKTSGRANLEMDYPVFTSASLAGSTLSLAGYVGSAPGQSVFASARVEVFISDVANTNGQGKTYLGYLTSDANGNFSGTISSVAGVTTGSSKITGTATDTSNNTSEFGPNLTVTSLTLAGTVFEDVHYGGGAGRSLAASSGAGVAGATVELYDSSGNFVASTTTAGGGGYGFAGVAANNAYFVRVVGPTVASTRSGSTAGLVGVLTWRTTAASGSAVAVTDMVGGSNPALADPGAASSGAAFNTGSNVFTAGLSGTAQAVTPVSVGAGGIAGLDFGFNFDTVVNTSDTGAGSLRQAITNANTLGGDASLAQSGRSAGIENIVFMLPNGSSAAGLRSAYNAFTTSAGAYNVATFTPASALPVLATPLVVDAQTQPGFTTNPLLELRGNAAGSTDGLTVAASGVVLRGWIVNRFSGNGINVSSGGGATVQGCWVGTTAAGAAAAANTGNGIAVAGSGNSQQIGGPGATQRNVVSGNGGHGLSIGGSGGGHLVQGNYVGTNAAGSAAVANVGRGIYIDTTVTSATLGGTAAGAGNVISGNTDYAVWLAGGATTVQGNTIGLNAAGTAALANPYGIFAASGGHQIGGTSAAARNVVSGNTNRGIWLNSAGNTVQGNYVGTNAAGTAALANTDGIYSKGASNTIGGTAVGAGNLVAGNSAAGILLNAIATGSTVQGNVVGLNAAGSAALANAVGINVQCSSGCAVGGTATGAGNTVSGNSGNGVQVAAGSSGNAILGNAVWGNGSLGIDLGADGVTANDGAKTSGQANLLMDAPVLTSARARGNQLTVAGYVGSAAGQSVFASSRVEVFVSDNDASGYGEGKTYLGYLTADASGNFSGTVTMPQATLAIGSKLTATATDGSSNTSEFGATFAALVVDLVVNSTLDEADSSAGDGRCLTASGVCTLRAAVAELNAQPSLATTPVIVFAIPGCSSYGSAGCKITPATALPSVTRAMGIDATTQSGWNATSFAPLIEVDGSAAPAATSGLVLSANGSTIRGLAVNRFGGNGITVSGSGNLLAGNSIGLNAAGAAAAANGGAGVSLTGSGNTVGGSSAADRNVIAGNTGHGILVGASTSSILGNAIGTNAAGSGGLGNGGSGVQVQSAALTGVSVSANTIANNASRGVGIASGGAAQVSVLGNAIAGNGALGIDLGNDGVTANTGSLNASMPNSGMNMPVVTGAGVAADGLSVTVYGYVGTGSGQAAFAGARVEVFKAAADASGYGEGQIYLGALTADANGRFNGTLGIASGSLAVGDAVTATATLAGNSSEFAANWTTTTVAALAPAGFNAFETSTAAGALSGVITSKTAGAAASLAVIALDSSGSALHPGFSGTVSLTWLDARDDTGAASGSCRASWAGLGSAGSAVFSNASRITVSVTPPASGTRAMRLKISYTGSGGTVVACSNDAFAALPSSLAWINASDADAATAGTARVLANTGASGGVVHRAGRPFTVRAQALDATGALMTGYDGSPALAAAGCLLPSGCTAATLGATTAAASGGVYTNNTVNYAEVGALQLQLSDTTYGAVDAADTALAARTITTSALAVGRFVPDSLVATVSTNGVLGTGNGACMASGQGATFIGQGFGWTTAPQVTVTAYNAAGAVTTRWTGALMKLAAGSGTPTLAVSGQGSASFSASYGAMAMQDKGNGQAGATASSTDRFLLDLAAGAVQASVTPSWGWTLAVSDASEAGTSGNPTLTASATQAGVGFDLGGVFHSGRLALAPAVGDARSGVQALVHLQRWTSAGWVTMTEDRGCVTVQRQHLGVEAPAGVFTTAAGTCAAPLAAAATSTRGGRVWLALPGTPGAAAGRLTLRLAGAAASGTSCTAGGATAALAPMGLPWLLGGSSGSGPVALATWGRTNRDTVLRRETW